MDTPEWLIPYAPEYTGEGCQRVHIALPGSDERFKCRNIVQERPSLMVYSDEKKGIEIDGSTWKRVRPQGTVLTEPMSVRQQ